MTVKLIREKRFADARGWFAETWNRARLAAAGIDIDFCQDNHSYSALAGTVRGLHFQTPPSSQAKLVRCTRGRIFDVAVDVRRDSPTFGEHLSVILSASGGEQLFVPVGYAHGFMTLEPDCEVMYKVSAPYSPESEGGVRWDDPALGIAWPTESVALLSDKDAILPSLAEIAPAFAYDGIPLTPIQ